MRPVRVELDIEQLVLHGFAPDDRQRIGAAVRRELSRLLATHGVPAAVAGGGAVPQLDGGSFDVPHGGRPDAIGGQVATAVYKGLGK